MAGPLAWQLPGLPREGGQERLPIAKAGRKTGTGINPAEGTASVKAQSLEGTSFERKKGVSVCGTGTMRAGGVYIGAAS